MPTSQNEIELTQYYSLVTNVGITKTVSVIPEEKRLNITEIVIGDGNNSPTIPDRTQTELVNEVWRGPISNYEIQPDKTTILHVVGSVPADVGSFNVYEVGIIDEDGDLIAVANMPGLPKVKDTSGLGIDLRINFIVDFENDVKDKIVIQVVPDAVQEVKETVDKMLANCYQCTDKDIDDIFLNYSDVPELPPVTGGCDCDHNHEDEIASESDIDQLF